MFFFSFYTSPINSRQRVWSLAFFDCFRKISDQIWIGRVETRLQKGLRKVVKEIFRFANQRLPLESMKASSLIS